MVCSEMPSCIGQSGPTGPRPYVSVERVTFWQQAALEFRDPGAQDMQNDDSDFGPNRLTKPLESTWRLEAWAPRKLSCFDWRMPPSATIGSNRIESAGFDTHTHHPTNPRLKHKKIRQRRQHASSFPRHHCEELWSICAVIVCSQPAHRLDTFGVLT